jgi:hypothetical protein
MDAATISYMAFGVVMALFAAMKFFMFKDGK